MWAFGIVNVFEKLLLNILRFCILILVIKLFVMNSTHFKRSPDSEYSAVSLHMTSCMEHLSDKYIHGKSEVRDDGVGTNPIIMDCKTEDCTDLGEISSVSRIKLEREEKVCMFDIEFVKHYII